MQRGYRVSVSRTAFVFVSLLVLTCASAFAQGVSSSVNGALVDPTGAGVPGAVCKLAEQTTGGSLTATSGLDGLFRFPTVPAGAYTL